MSPKLLQITPFVPVADLERSIRFFQEILGFETISRMEGYAFVRNGNVALRLITAAANKDLRDPNSQLHCYIDVTGLDELYSQLKPRLDQLPTGRVSAPFDSQYGQREFHVIDEDALLLTFGERIGGRE